MPGNNICGCVNPKHLIQMFHCSMEECDSAAVKYIVILGGALCLKACYIFKKSPSF